MSSYPSSLHAPAMDFLQRSGETFLDEMDFPSGLGPTLRMQGDTQKVAHVLRKYDPDAWGGTESALIQLLLGLRQYGVDSVVFAPALKRTSTSPDPLQAAGFTVRRFGAFLPVAGLASEERDRRVSVGGNLMSFSLPLMLALEPAVDVVHSHALGRLGGIARKVAKARNLPFVVTIHGGYMDLPDNVRTQIAGKGEGFEYGKVFGLLAGARQVVPEADAVLTCNPREADLLAKQSGARRVECMPHGIDTGTYAVDQRAAALDFLPALAGRRVLLSVGRIDAVKNQAFLVEHMPRLAREYPDLALVLAGPVTDHAHEAQIHQLVKANGLQSSVFLPGGIPPGDPRLVGLYQLASMVVLPSHSETFGLVLIESWSAGTPVLSTPTSGAMQVLDPGRNGRVFTLDDPETYYGGVRSLLENPGEAERMAQRGAALVRARYAREAVAHRFITLYDELRCDT